VLVTKVKNLMVCILLTLTMVAFFTVPAYGSESDEALQTAYDAYGWLWCLSGYSDYC
jgi:hypothetical protein